ncbi:MAG: lysylphosphatidylglycerol synthase domain-containing protein, partial [Gaiellaceae bacterium]
VSLRAVGISFADLPPSEAFLAWAVGRVISSLPLTPGGIGVVELGMIGTLVGFGVSNAHAVAAVLLYRGVIVLPTLVIGLLALPMLHRVAPAPAENT